MLKKYFLLFTSISILLYCSQLVIYQHKTKPKAYLINTDEKEINFKELFLNPKYSICGEDSREDLLFIAFVIKAPDLFKKRNDIRNTGGNKHYSPDF